MHRLAILGAFAVLWAVPAEAHIGAVAATAKIKAPAPLPVAVDGGVSVAPYTFASADASFEISWEDGDVDPTGRFYFYYVPRELPYQVDFNAVKALGTAIPEGQGIFISCTCDGDGGVVCDPTPNRDCRNSFMWDTSNVPAGTYWIAALNSDPPFEVYSMSRAPVRIAHGGATLPPAVVVLRPDGFGSFSSTYDATWYAVGTGKLTFELAYGVNDTMKVLGPVTPLPKDTPIIDHQNGLYSFNWSLTDLEDAPYFLRVRVKDDSGHTVTSDSRFALSAFHGETDDLGLIAEDDLEGTKMIEGGDCSATTAPRTWPPVAAVLLFFVALGLVARAWRRSGDR